MKYSKVSMYLGVIAWALVVVGILVFANLYELASSIILFGFFVGSIGVVFTLIAVLKRESSKFLFISLLMNGITAIVIVLLAWIFFTGGA